MSRRSAAPGAEINSVAPASPPPPPPPAFCIRWVKAASPGSCQPIPWMKWEKMRNTRKGVHHSFYGEHFTVSIYTHAKQCENCIQLICISCPLLLPLCLPVLCSPKITDFPSSMDWQPRRSAQGTLREIHKLRKKRWTGHISGHKRNFKNGTTGDRCKNSDFFHGNKCKKWNSM